MVEQWFVCLEEDCTVSVLELNDTAPYKTCDMFGPFKSAEYATYHAIFGVDSFERIMRKLKRRKS